jgi:L-asparaginase II
VGLGRAFRRIALGVDASGVPDSDAARIAEAIRSHPAYVSGTTRDELRLLTAVPGAIGKAGAEACYAVALPDGRAFALKIDDGGARARPVVMAEALRRSGVPTDPGVDADALDDTGVVPVLGAGEPVGEIRSTF